MWIFIYVEHNIMYLKPEHEENLNNKVNFYIFIKVCHLEINENIFTFN